MNRFEVQHGQRSILNRSWLAIGLAAVVGLAALPRGPIELGAAAGAVADALPARLSDSEFWKLVTDLSEPDGAFHSDNFTSNEADFAQSAAELAAGSRGGAYLGVGPEQNFSYMVAVRPEIAFIIDIRRQAIVQHLLYKALFELSANRADFIARLFSRPRPGGLDKAPLRKIWQAMPDGDEDDLDRYVKNRGDVVDQLTNTHGFALTPEDLASLEYVYRAFFELGPDINYAGYQARLTTGNMNFAKLSLAADPSGSLRSFLATEETFQFVKSMQARNLVVPVQGDFAGPRALRGIGAYLRAHDVRVTAFYISNVEQYLFGHSISPEVDVNGGWKRFYDNVGALPIDRSSVLVRSPSASTNALCPIAPFLEAVAAGRVQTQTQAKRCGA